MATVREHIYAIMEVAKALSDDSLMTEEYALYLLNRKREYLLDQKFSNYKADIPEIVKQTIEIGMTRVQRIPGLNGDYVVRSTLDIPTFANIDRLINSTTVSGRDFMESYLNLVPYERFLHVGKDRWLKDQIYGALRDGKLYLKSGNFREKGITILNITGIFSNPEEAYERSINYSIDVPFLDIKYPLTETLADTAIRMIKEDLESKSPIREDDRNNASPN